VNPTINPSHYTYRVTWSAEDGEFVATCVELPSLSWLAAIPGDALAGVARAAADVVADLYACGEDVPVPLADRSYSGRFNVRVPATLHRQLVTEAADQGISLNRLISDRLAHT
jgi:predicted HicB family RNase H-like nuclease